ncbi:hypothetical protein FBR05_07170 [Deltaproteobacteria bacterium PRO3]|nr:hypothetical protein [Deltaproteobacteria bacterium PRO3]
MKKFMISGLSILSLFLVAGSKVALSADKPAAAPAAPAAAAPAQDFDVQKAIAAGDHKGLAAFYKAQAQAYRDKAAKHEHMHADYKKSHVHYKGMENSLAAHCAILKERALETAKQYDALAAEEEKLAAQGK